MEITIDGNTYDQDQLTAAIDEYELAIKREREALAIGPAQPWETPLWIALDKRQAEVDEFWDYWRSWQPATT